MTSEKMAGRSREGGEFSRGACTLFRDITRLFNLRSVAGWLETQGRLMRRLCGEFYASYAATLRGFISSGRSHSSGIHSHPHWFRMRGHITAAIRRFLYGLLAGHSWSCLAGV
ncbi:hypothetical protein H5410_042078 [Solanum commersonii]|uniref:Uncharacterized protein n=1 Tax=Solanum commersonii TaxID=4109 RepID=A0A9J5XWH6_SOLCO|nr:hypothetical protein H5410_042078 [Solanum commersonii]